MRADVMRAGEAARAMGGDGQNAPAQPQARRARRPARGGVFGKMQAAGVNGGGETPIARDKKKETARAAQRGQFAREGRAVRGAIVTKNDRASTRQRRDGGGNIAAARLVRQKPHGGKTLRFELTAGVC